MPEKHVTQDSCNSRHTTWRWGFGVVLAIVGTSVWAGWDAQQMVRVHAAAAEERNDAITESLARIETTQIRMDNRLNTALNKTGP